MSRPSFATRWNLDAVEDAYQRWRQDPQSVDESWRIFFEGFELGANLGTPGDAGPMGIVRLVQAYRELGHFQARIDPLTERPQPHQHLQLSEYGLSDGDLDRISDTHVFHGRPPA